MDNGLNTKYILYEVQNISNKMCTWDLFFQLVRGGGECSIHSSFMHKWIFSIGWAVVQRRDRKKWKWRSSLFPMPFWFVLSREAGTSVSPSCRFGLLGFSFLPFLEKCFSLSYCLVYFSFNNFLKMQRCFVIVLGWGFFSLLKTSSLAVLINLLFQ